MARMRRLLIATLLLTSAGCFDGGQTDPYWQGYLEGEYLYLSAPVAGYLQELAVSRGDSVAAGGKLFSLDPEPEATAVQEAEARVAAAAARLADLGKGERKPELETLAARLQQARVDLDLADKQRVRQESLFRQNLVQAETVDTARATAERDKARVAEMKAALETGQLGGRTDAIAAAKAERDAAVQALAQARWRLAQKQVTAPEAGRINDTFFYPGEWIPAAKPVVSLLPPERLQLRFFAPEPDLAGLRIGQRVQFRCDGCSETEAVVSFVATEAEYTPPVIYSEHSRSKLVYRVEAKLDRETAQRMHAGQPVEVRPSPQATQP